MATLIETEKTIHEIKVQFISPYKSFIWVNGISQQGRTRNFLLQGNLHTGAVKYQVPGLKSSSAQVSGRLKSTVLKVQVSSIKSQVSSPRVLKTQVSGRLESSVSCLKSKFQVSSLLTWFYLHVGYLASWLACKHIHFWLSPWSWCQVKHLALSNFATFLIKEFSFLLSIAAIV